MAMICWGKPSLDLETAARPHAELDTLYAHLYGLTRDELAYILDTFPIVRRKDEERWGEPGVSQSNPIGRSG